jgi:predicted ABC-type ATPase
VALKRSRLPPILFVLAGPNGAGKTTYFDYYLRPRIDPIVFVNPDRLVLAELGRAALMLVESERGQALADTQRDELMLKGQSFVTESTFSHPSKLELLRLARGRGYRTFIYHIGVESADVSVERVSARVAEGGHPVPEDKIRGRFTRNRSYIREAVLTGDSGVVLDNTSVTKPFQLLYSFSSGQLAHADPNPPQWAAELYGGHLA